MGANDALAAVVCILAIGLEAMSDRQMDAFQACALRSGVCLVHVLACSLDRHLASLTDL